MGLLSFLKEKFRKKDKTTDLDSAQEQICVPGVCVYMYMIFIFIQNSCLYFSTL